jgi:cysteine-rich repeat protein
LTATIQSEPVKSAPSAVPALAIDPSSPSTLYATMSNSVMFKSTNGGTSWSGIDTGPYFVSALVIDPSTPTTLYAGTSDGVFKSTDGGTSWSAPGVTNTITICLAIDPSSPSTLYAGTIDGVFKSTDGGTSWSAMSTGLTITYVPALAIDPSTSTTLYSGTQGGGVFKSTNGGTSWDAMNTGLTDTLVNTLAIDPDTPTTLYAGTYFGGVFSIQQLCGNSVLDAGEQCDDGNQNNNDACKNDCTPNVCGDGVVYTGVEQCDDSNQVDGDGCSATCQSEFIPGGGSTGTDCVHEWLTNPVPVLDRKGRPTNRLACTDDDPTCDFGTTTGECSFHVAMGFDISEQRFACTPTDVAFVQLRQPNQATPRDGVDKDNSDALV